MSQPSCQAGQDDSSTQAFAAALASLDDHRNAECRKRSEHKALTTHLVTRGTVPKPTPAYKATFKVLAAFP